MNYPKAIADFFRHSLTVTGLSDNVDTDVTGSELYLPKGRYYIIFGGEPRLNFTVIPSYASGTAFMTDASNNNLAVYASSSMSQINTAIMRSYNGGGIYFETSGEVIKLRANINESGGTVSDRELNGGFMFVYNLN